MPLESPASDSFSTTVGLLYVFNLIVGTGALTLPRAFQTAGYVLGTMLLLLSSLASYVCVTFVIECLAIANAVLKIRRGASSTIPSSDSGNQLLFPENNSIDDRERFRITKCVELTEMAHIFLGRYGVTFTYLALSVYLFGDLGIYSITVPKSLMNVICASPSVIENTTERDLPCHIHASLPAFITRLFVYRVCVVLFAAFCTPMILIGMTRTKYVQLATIASRWTAFILMIVLASMQLITQGAQGSPPAANLNGFGSFFGVAVYAFMCHHSIPGLVTPMRNTSFLCYRIGLVYALIFVFYATLSLTGSFAFEIVRDVYTLNFLHDDQTGNIFYFFIDYFLALFPVFTLTSSYIIVAITLCNNLRVLYAMCAAYWNGNNDSLSLSTASTPSRSMPASRTRPLTTDDENEALLNTDEDVTSSNQIAESHASDASATTEFAYNWRALSLPVLVVGLPMSLSLFTDNVLPLASVTGSYPGVGVQFVIPSALMISVRTYMRAKRRAAAFLPTDEQGDDGENN